MSTALDALTLRKLTFIKQLYLHAVALSYAVHNDLFQTLAIIQFDLANETILKAAAERLGTSAPSGMPFPKVIDHVNGLLKPTDSKVPHQGHILSIHTSRNNAQHQAILPHASVIDEARVHTKDFLKEFMLTIWVADYEQLSIANSVKDQKVRGYLLAAENELAKHNYQEAANNAGAALQWTLQCVQFPIVGNRDSFLSVSSFDIAAVNSEWNTINGSFKKIQDTLIPAFKTLRKMQNTLLYAMLALNYDDYLKFERIVGHIYFSGGDTPYGVGGTQEITPENVEWAVTYSTDTVRHIENRVGDLTKPFGQEHWY